MGVSIGEWISLIQSNGDMSETRCLPRAQKILKNNTHPCWPLGKDTEVSAAIPQEYGAEPPKRLGIEPATSFTR